MTKFLIADDHSLIRKGLSALLREEFPGAEVSEVTDSSALIKEAVVQKWDLIISDISMPGRNILETLKQLKKYCLPPRCSSSAYTPKINM